LSYSGTIQNATDFYRKLLQEGDALQQTITSRHLMNFAMTAYHLREWITNGAYTQTAKDSTGNLFNHAAYVACRDIANGSKHFTITRYVPDTDKVEAKQGYGHGRYCHGPYGVGEESIIIEMTDRTQWNALDFKNDVIDLWTNFFQRNGIAT
jgi:hypothetical protein